LAAYADGGRFASNARIADINVEIACGKLTAITKPMAMLPLPVLPPRAAKPQAVLLSPLTLVRNALRPIAMLSSPVSL
jgi:hypothetical protein